MTSSDGSNTRRDEGYALVEMLLVVQGLLTRVSTYHHLAADGVVTPEDPSC